MKRILPYMVSGVALLHATGSYAQTINYGELQELFNEPVTTSATGKPQRASEAPVALEIVTAEQIRRMGVTSLPEVLNRLVGVTNWQATRSFSDVGIRGQNSAENATLLVLVNGRQVYIDNYGYTDWALIPVQLEEIRQVEVVKGPTTALYGFNAVSGVVNIITYNPKYDDKDEVGVAAGTDDYYRAYAFDTVKLSDRANFRISGSQEGFDEFDLKSDTNYPTTGTFRNSNRNQKMMADGMIQLTDSTQLRLEGSYADVVDNQAFAYFISIPTNKSMNSAKATVTSETGIGLVEGNVYINNFHQHFRDTIPGNQDNQIFVAQLQDLFKIGTDHTFRLQGEYRHNSLMSGEFIGPNAELSYDDTALSGMWNWALASNLEWNNSLRFDHLVLGREGAFTFADPYPNNNPFDRNIDAYSANSGIVWKATDLDTLRASFGRGIQIPSLIQFGLMTPGGGPIVIAGNADLEPTVVQNYEIGYDRALAAIGGKFRSSLFYKKTHNINAAGATFFPSGGSFIVGAGPVGSSQTAGIELSLDGTIGKEWKWDASYTYQNTNDEFPGAPGTVTAFALRYDNTVPHHVLKGHLGYTAGPWAADAFGELGSSFDALQSAGLPNPLTVVELDGYATMGGRVGYTFEDDFTLALFGSNLMTGGVTNNYGLEDDQRVFISLSKKF